MIEHLMIPVPEFMSGFVEWLMCGWTFGMNYVSHPLVLLFLVAAAAYFTYQLGSYLFSTPEEGHVIPPEQQGKPGAEEEKQSGPPAKE